MVGSRPCRVCRKWFRPDGKVGNRQHVCGAPDCQKEWHRRACADWHRRNTDYDQHTRFVNRLVADDPPGQRPLDPMVSIKWTLARNEVGLKVSVLVEEVMKVILRRVRETSIAQPRENKTVPGKVMVPSGRETSIGQVDENNGVSSKVIPRGVREEIGARRPFP